MKRLGFWLGCTVLYGLLTLLGLLMGAKYGVLAEKADYCDGSTLDAMELGLSLMLTAAVAGVMARSFFVIAKEARFANCRSKLQVAGVVMVLETGWAVVALVQVLVSENCAEYLGYVASAYVLRGVVDLGAAAVVCYVCITALASSPPAPVRPMRPGRY